MKLLYFEEFGKLSVPQRLRPHLRKILLNAGIVEVPYRQFGMLFYFMIFSTLGVYFIKVFPVLQDKGYNLFFFFLLTFVVVAGIAFFMAIVMMVLVYSYVDLKVFNRTKGIEEVLDDYLNLVSENIKGGMSLDRAMWAAVKPEHGVLAKEIQVSAKKVATGQPIEQALVEFTEKYDSPMTKRALGLIIEGAQGGADVSLIIDKVVDNIRETKLLKKEMIAANATYTIFITFIVLVIAPALFALSFQLLNILTQFSTKIGSSASLTSAALPINFSGTSLSIHDFLLFSRLTLL
ncbi:type II secretion system F family protein, partial [Candidatus Woesearchaeota archaeon]|nr:type II secretion system F family protein [Candidatus Woesearchaeota archaeon]